MTKYLFLEYPKCSTCQKPDNGWNSTTLILPAATLSKTTRRRKNSLWHRLSGLPFKRFVNTSGLLYKSMNLKEKLPTLNEDEQFALLATNGMLVKRPLLIGSNLF
ncbi:MAG: ArsC/Spx/MgsR family protein [Alphaproteobacteria bacterium]